MLQESEWPEGTVSHGATEQRSTNGGPPLVPARSGRHMDRERRRITSLASYSMWLVIRRLSRSVPRAARPAAPLRSLHLGDPCDKTVSALSATSVIGTPSVLRCSVPPCDPVDPVDSVPSVCSG